MTVPTLSMSDEVAQALADGRALVALESSLVAQGLPAPHNLETARDAERAVREAGAVPATTAVEAGRLVLGASDDLVERLADPDRRPRKAGSRDLGPVLASGALAATTVSAAMRIAWLGGVPILATGGIGGVHRGGAASHDVSSDIDELAATPVAVVCSGAKSILDLPATLELLETRRVPVVGYRTDEFPSFYSSASGLGLEHRVEDPSAAARAIAAHMELPGGGGLLLVQPPPSDLALDVAQVEAWIVEALASASTSGLRGGAVTPFVLDQVARVSGGRALRVNIGLIVNNARTAAVVSVELARAGERSAAGE